VKKNGKSFGVSAAADGSGRAAARGGCAAPAEEKTDSPSCLPTVGGNKINVIKAVRRSHDLGLKEARTSWMAHPDRQEG